MEASSILDIDLLVGNAGKPAYRVALDRPGPIQVRLWSGVGAMASLFGVGKSIMMADPGSGCLSL